MESAFRNLRVSVSSILLAIGTTLLAFSCAPANAGAGGNDPIASGAVTNLVISETNAENVSFVVQWADPVETGTKLDGTSLSPTEVVYRIYYLAESAEHTKPITVKSIQQNPNTQIQEVTKVSQVRISELELDTRYFITVASYNIFAQLETASSEMVDASIESAFVASGAVTDLSMEESSIDSNSFLVEWTEPVETGKKPDGTWLAFSEIMYRIYYIERTYLVGTTDQTEPDAEPGAEPDTEPDAEPSAEPDTERVTAELIQQNPNTQIREVTGIPQLRIMRLKPNTRYFITVASYNIFAQLETASSEVLEGSTVTEGLVFNGALSYTQTEYRYVTGFSTKRIRPVAVPSTDGTVPIRYVLEKGDGVVFDPKPTINEVSGVVTINSISNIRTARFVVRISAEGYTTQYVTLTIIVGGASLNRSLSYNPEYQFSTGLYTTITPTSTPIIPRVADGVSIRYALARSTGTEFVPEPTIVNDSGVIIINSIANEGKASFVVRASAEGYVTQVATLTIVISTNGGVPQVGTYYNNVVTDALPVGLGQAIADSGVFSMTDDTVLFTIFNLATGDYTIHFGLAVNGEVENYNGGSYQKIVSNGTIELLKSELALHSFPFVDGSVIGVSSGLGITGIQHVATYRPSNIYNHQDLQAMRQDLDRDYILKGDIEVASADEGAGTSNYEAVGNDETPFTGSLDGAGYTITGVQIKNFEDYQGLFGVMDVGTTGIVLAQNLVLRNFKITGNAFVGSLAGWVKEGVIDSVYVEVRNADAGKIEVNGSVNYNGYGGGLVGFAGTDGASTEVRIKNTSSAVAVVGSGSYPNKVGGIVGYMNSHVTLTESYATGSVISTGSHVGGLVGHNKGYVLGYAMGDAAGNDFVGGLIGWNEGTVTGYATGAVIGNNFGGGLVGLDGNGVITGYARGIVRRRDGNGNASFGKTIGVKTGTSITTTYSSTSENELYDGSTGTTVLTNTFGDNGIEVNVSDRKLLIGQVLFERFHFGSELGKWTWVEDGKWPAINIGKIKAADEQPVDACIFALSFDQCIATSRLRVMTYYGEVIDELPVNLGQGVGDNGVFSMEESTVVLSILDLMVEGEHTIHLRSAAGDFSGSYQKTITDGNIEILKSELKAYSFSFENGAVIGISGPSFRETQLVATYSLSNIYSHYDLQAMRRTLAQDYALKNDIEFPSVDAGSSNYVTVGGVDNLFTGTLNGAGYSITGLVIESSEDYQGLFGAIKGRSSDTVVAHDLDLRDFKIAGNTHVGSLAGYMIRGTVDNVHIKVSAPGAGKVSITGNITYGTNPPDGIVFGDPSSTKAVVKDSFGGGLVGLLGGSGRVIIQNTSSATMVVASGGGSYVGGLVGYMTEDTLIGSYVTGSVTSTGEHVGGLVGYQKGGVVRGYVTGDVGGIKTVGGLAGQTSGGTIVGYVIGSVSGVEPDSEIKAGDQIVGGLVGKSTGRVIGYALGDVSVYGNDAGGLVGQNNQGGVVIGYSRNIVRAIENGLSLDIRFSFGKITGFEKSGAVSSQSYSSETESAVYYGRTGEGHLRKPLGTQGISVTVTSSTTQETFSSLAFGTALGQWTWVEDGKWPAINIGNVKAADEQPVGIHKDIYLLGTGR